MIGTDEAGSCSALFACTGANRVIICKMIGAITVKPGSAGLVHCPPGNQVSCSRVTCIIIYMTVPIIVEPSALADGQSTFIVDHFINQAVPIITNSSTQIGASANQQR